MKFKKPFKNRYFYYFLLLFLFFVGSVFVLRSLANFGRRVDLDDASPAVKIVRDNDQPATVFFSNEDTGGGNSDFLSIIEKEIDSAQYSLDAAVYSFKSERLREALYRAAKRGVAVRLLLSARDQNQHEIFFADAPANFKRIEAGEREQAAGASLMHHKFLLIDGGHDNQKLLFGSFNWTDLQAAYDNSFLLLSQQADIIEAFSREFERLAVGLSGKKKMSDVSYKPFALDLQAGGYDYELWFSPGSRNYNINARLAAAMASAKENLRVLAWSLTDKDLADSLLGTARRGLKVEIIADSYNLGNKDSLVAYLLKKKQEEKLDNLEIFADKEKISASESPAENDEKNIDPFLHQHLLIVDGKTVFAGSGNWSRSGAFYNDESLLVSDESTLVEAFSASFSRQRKEARNLAE